MEAAANIYSSSNADVLPFIEQLGAPPAALHSLTDTHSKRWNDELLVTFSFGKTLQETDRPDVAAYCAGAFNQLGFNLPPETECEFKGNAQGGTNFSLHIPSSALPTCQYDITHDRDEKKVVTHTRDDVEAQWKALRVIRQAAVLKRASQVAFG